jgi:hypothetical protein
MSEDTWGPLPHLAQLLACAPEGPPPDDKTWCLAVQRYGGLWGAYTRGIWPPHVGPPALGGHKFAWRSLWRWIPDLLRRLFSQLDTPQAGLDDFISAMIECHAWLGSQNLRAAQRWFSPLWQSFPLELTAVTQRGLAWSLYAYALTQRGAEKAILPAGADDFDTLNDEATLGDCVAVHLCVERLVDYAGRRLAPNVPDDPEPERRGGGLRSSRFLSVYPYLVARANVLGVSSWLSALTRLVEASPLTQMIYLDAIARVAERSRFGHLSRIGRTGEKVTAWGEMWLSHLARSVVGAVLSDPPALELVRYWEERARELTAPATKWARKTGAKPDDYPELEQAHNAYTAARNTYPDQYRTRITILPRLLGLREGDSGSPYLPLRALDMLVRRSVASSGDTLAKQWKTAQEELSAVLARDVLFASPTRMGRLLALYGKEGAVDERSPLGPVGAGYEAVIRLLFGQEWREEASAAPRTDPVRQAVETLLTPPSIGASVGRVPADDDVRAVASEAGLTFQAAKRLVTRFYETGVEFPFPTPNDRGLPPVDILTEILAEVTNAAEAVTEEEAI